MRLAADLDSALSQVIIFLSSNQGTPEKEEQEAARGDEFFNFLLREWVAGLEIAAL